jgi:Protein of unknown function (DUF1523).
MNRFGKFFSRNIALISIIAVLVFIIGTGMAYAYATRSTITATVTDKGIKTESYNQNYVDSNYMIYTDNGTFEDTDSIWYMKFNSSDVYGNIEVGNTYTFQVYGWRIPLFSCYQNIITVN